MPATAAAAASESAKTWIAAASKPAAAAPSAMKAPRGPIVTSTSQPARAAVSPALRWKSASPSPSSSMSASTAIRRGAGSRARLFSAASRARGFEL
jgi:hypothetical protein